MGIIRLRTIPGTLTPTEFGALANPAYIAVDEDTLSTAEKLDLKGLILSTDDEIRTHSDKDYYLVSPKALLELLGSDSEKGLVQLASQTNIEDGDTDNVIPAKKMGVVIAEARKSLFQVEGSTQNVFASQYPPELYSSIVSNWCVRDNNGMSVGNLKQMLVGLSGEGIGYDTLRISLNIRTNLGYYMSTKNLVSSSSALTSACGSTGISVYVYADGVNVALRATSTLTFLSASAVIQATIKSV
jgi:hypothetical protein